MQIQLNFAGPHEATKVVAQQLYVGVWSVIGGDVKGDIAEFGTMSGITAQVLAMALQQMTIPQRGVKRLHLFDSFEGLPEATAEADTGSPHVQSNDWRPGGCTGISAEQLREAVTKFLPDDRVSIHEGWYADRVPRLPADTRLGLLHVDCDMYQSTIDALEPCFANGWVTRGAHLYFDDWNCNRADPRFGERKAWAELAERFRIDFSSGGDYAAFSHKLIVHGYDGMPED